MQLLIIASLLVSCVVTSLRTSPNAFKFRSSTGISANKLDGITIDGDLIPLQNNLLIKVKQAATATAGGLYIPDNAKERPTEGVCIAGGKGRNHPDTGLLIEIAVNPGESVIYGKYDGSELKYNDENHQMIKDDDVLLKFKGDEPTFENVQPVKDQVMIKLPPKEASNAAGIIVTTAESKEKRVDYGTVAKVGPGRTAGNGAVMPIQVAPGEGVRFRDFAGSDVKIEGVEYRIIRAYDIIAKWSQKA